MNPDSSKQPIQKVTYPQIREGIQTGDLLLFKGRGWVSRLIARVLCRPYSHVGLLVRRDDRVMVYQALMRGVCMLPAREAVSQYDGLVDWWSLRRDKAEKLDVDRLCQLADAGVGRSFGIWGMLQLGWAVLTGRDRGRPETDPSVQEMFCSQYISHCFRLAGFDPCPAFADHQTSPADLETCGFFERRQRLLDGRHLMAGELLGPSSVRPAA